MNIVKIARYVQLNTRNLSFNRNWVLVVDALLIQKAQVAYFTWRVPFSVFIEWFKTYRMPRYVFFYFCV